MGLRAKFNITLTVTFLVALAIAAPVIWWIEADHARKTVLNEARILREAALAIRQYTATEVRPLLSPHYQDQFLPHTVPSFAAQQNLLTVEESLSNYSYKEAALNPTNPADLADDFEAALIEELRSDASLTELARERNVDGTDVIAVAYPLKINSEGCLDCHSTPDVAPQPMLALYGDQNGFGWELGEIIGAQVVTVPMSLPFERALQTFLIVMAAMAGIFLFVFIVLNIVLTRVIVRPVRQMAQIADDVSLGKADVAEFDRPGSDEISRLATSFTRMRRSLEQALKMLES